MVNVNEPEQESDEDCEVYFLKPVNEYNIVDKIKEANKELFSPEPANDQEQQIIELMSVELSINRKVKFAQNLEEYEPQSGISTKELEATLGKAITSEDITELKLEVIKEEESSTNEVEPSTENDKNQINDGRLINKMKRQESIDNLKECFPAEELSQPIEVIQEDIILEEICEEILVMDMGSDKALQLLDTKSESPGTKQRRMLKQITFDYDEEQDNKSLTNLLISDNEYDNDPDEAEYNCNESINEETDTDEQVSFENNNEFYENEEDDKLSIIIASYLPDDLVGDNNFITSKKSSPNSYRKSRKLQFNKRFSFRRKSKSSNAIAACSGSSNSNKHRFVPPPEVTDLKLHYKTCCEFKNGQQKLPNYTGYLSEYGLSREQLFERERKLQQKHHGLLQDTLKTSEDDKRKIHDNERAFTKWLKNKMRFPINKTRNMFDVKRPFGLRKYTSVGGGNSLANEQSNIITNTTKYRSISAKIRKG